MTVKFINAWKSKVKQTDKVEIVARVSKVTVFGFVGDWSRGELVVTLFNYRLRLDF